MLTNFSVRQVLEREAKKAPSDNKMKTIRTIIVSSALLINAAHTNLIDLTPGGFDPRQGLPPAFHRLQTHIFFDEAAHGYFDTPGGTV